MYFDSKCIHLAILEDFNLKSNSFKTLALQRIWLVTVNRYYLHTSISFKITESYVNKDWQKFQKTIRNCQSVYFWILHSQNFTARFWFCKISHQVLTITQVNKAIKSKKIQRQLMRNLVSPRVSTKKAAHRCLKISEKKWLLKLNQVKYVSNT